MGNFVATISDKGAETKIKCGVVIVAIGAQALKPEGLFNYDGKKVVTHLELESRLNEGTVDAKNIAIIQCVGSRCKERTYCSRICSVDSPVRNSIPIKESSPDTKHHLLS